MEKPLAGMGSCTLEADILQTALQIKLEGK